MLQAKLVECTLASIIMLFVGIVIEEREKMKKKRMKTRIAQEECIIKTPYHLYDLERIDYSSLLLSREFSLDKWLLPSHFSPPLF